MDLDADMERWRNQSRRSSFSSYYRRPSRDVYGTELDVPSRHYFSDSAPSYRRAPPPPPPPPPLSPPPPSPPAAASDAPRRRNAGSTRRRSKDAAPAQRRSSRHRNSTTVRSEASDSTVTTERASRSASSTSSSSSSSAADSSASSSSSYSYDSTSDESSSTSSSGSTADSDSASASTYSSTGAPSRHRHRHSHRRSSLPAALQSALVRVAQRPGSAAQDEEMAAAAACRAILERETQLKEQELRLLRQKQKFAAEVQRRSSLSHRYTSEDEALRQMQRLVEVEGAAPSLDDFLRRTSTTTITAEPEKKAATDAGALAYLRSSCAAPTGGDGGGAAPTPLPSKSEAAAAAEAPQTAAAAAAAALTTTATATAHSHSSLEHSLPDAGHALLPSGEATPLRQTDGGSVTEGTARTVEKQAPPPSPSAPREASVTEAPRVEESGAKEGEGASTHVIRIELPRRRVKVKVRRRRSQSRSHHRLHSASGSSTDDDDGAEGRAGGHHTNATGSSAGRQRSPPSAAAQRRLHPQQPAAAAGQESERRSSSAPPFSQAALPAILAEGAPAASHTQQQQQQLAVVPSRQLLLLPPPPSPAGLSVPERQRFAVDPLTPYNPSSTQQPWAAVNWPHSRTGAAGQAPISKDGPPALWYASNTSVPLSQHEFKSLLCSEYRAPETTYAVPPPQETAHAVAMVSEDGTAQPAPQLAGKPGKGRRSGAAATAGRQRRRPSTGDAVPAQLRGGREVHEPYDSEEGEAGEQRQQRQRQADSATAPAALSPSALRGRRREGRRSSPRRRSVQVLDPAAEDDAAMEGEGAAALPDDAPGSSGEVPQPPLTPPPPPPLLAVAAGGDGESVVEFPPPPHLMAADMPPPGDVGSDGEDSCCGGCGGGCTGCCCGCWTSFVSCLFPCCCGPQKKKKKKGAAAAAAGVGAAAGNPDAAVSEPQRPLAFQRPHDMAPVQVFQQEPAGSDAIRYLPDPGASPQQQQPAMTLATVQPIDALVPPPAAAPVGVMAAAAPTQSSAMLQPSSGAGNVLPAHESGALESRAS